MAEYLLQVRSRLLLGPRLVILLGLVVRIRLLLVGKVTLVRSWLELREDLSRLLVMVGKGLLMSIGRSDLLLRLGMVARMEELGMIVLGQEAGVYILGVEDLEEDTDSLSICLGKPGGGDLGVAVLREEDLSGEDVA